MEQLLRFQIHKKLQDGTFGADEEGEEGTLKTSGSRAMDAYRMQQTGAKVVYDPTRGAQVRTVVGLRIYS